MNNKSSGPARARRSPPLAYSVWPGWRILMQDAGLGTAAILRRARLPDDPFARPTARLDSRSFFALWKAIEAESEAIEPGCPAPLRIAKVMSSDWFDPELFAALCSADMNGALDRISTFVRLVAPLTVRVERTPSRTNVTLEFMDDSQTPPEIFVAFKLVFFVQLARLATRSAIRPLKVEWPVTLTASHQRQYQEFFGVPVGHNPLATLSFSASDAARPFLTENHKMWTFFEPALRQRLNEIDRDASMEERLRSVLLEALPAGDVSMQEVSAKLAVSTRTLQRRLHAEGTSFQQVLDNVRDALAKHYLANSAMTGAQISFLLGFEDPNSFVRAFHARNGRTPEAVRASLQVTATV